MKVAAGYLVVFASLVAVGAYGSRQVSAQGKPRIFFVEPKNNATVKSPVHLKFGIENYKIAAVPEGDVKTARPGVGHYHVGVEQNCLKPGETIVKGTPQWVHLGKGDTEMEMQLTPGKHKLSLQLGDDLHNTVQGLCSTITVNVTQ
jgi:Domain of unknown function (DUF4399)/Family of unknown function (DUF6130)